MIYIKKIFNQDVNNQIAVPKDPSQYFFKQSTEKGKERDIVFYCYSLNENNVSAPIQASIKGYEIECRINGEFKGYLDKNFKLEPGDIIAFKDKSKDEFNFTYIKKDKLIEDIHRVFEIFDDNHCLYDESNILSKSDTELSKFSHNRIIFGAPGTGKSFQLQVEAKKYFYKTPETDEKQKMYNEIHAQPTNCDQAEWITTCGIRYSDYIFDNYINANKQGDLVNDFDLLEPGNTTTKKKEQLIQGAKAARCLGLHLKNNSDERIERVTFHPNYSFSQFVGTYKPVSNDVNGVKEISYEYVPGPFIRTYIRAKKSNMPQLLLIEEINRANVAAVFGDAFQLLDRNSNGESDYPVATSEDLRKFLESEGVANPEQLCIPSNMYIWATMNSADQGVMPMDTAFKRRWDFEYLDVDNPNAVSKIKTIDIPISRDGKKTVKWNEFRTKLNEKLSSIGINEDKLLGPFFLSKKSLETAMEESDKFVSLFESKVIMYLFEDVVKMQPGKLFTTDTRRYSKICKEFEEKGMELFGIDVEVSEEK